MNQDDLISLLQTELLGLEFSMAADDLVQYGQDWTRFYQPSATVVLFPRNISQVQQVVRLANRLQQPIVPSGGRTGYSAGAVAAAGEWVLSLEKMNRIVEFNPIDRSVVVEAGVITAQLQQFAVEQGLFYPVDFASAGSSQIGGNIATNAGGIKVLRYGLTRDYVLGLKVVNGSGELLELNRGLLKNAGGLDLRHLLIGSEGVLGIVVEAEIKLRQPPPKQAVMLLATASLNAVMEVFAQAGKLLNLSSFEFFSERALYYVMQHRRFEAPFAQLYPFYLLLEYDDDEAATMQLFEQCMEQGLVDDGIVAQSLSQAEQLWQYREGISEAIAACPPYKNDLSVKVSQVPEFMQRLEIILGEHYPDLETVWFGHIGDGNLHLNILKPKDWSIETFKSHCEQLNHYVYGLIEQMGGSISAEHGVGLLKKPFLHHNASATEIALMKEIKRTFDPNGILNRGKLVDWD